MRLFFIFSTLGNDYAISKIFRFSLLDIVVLAGAGGGGGGGSGVFFV